MDARRPAMIETSHAASRSAPGAGEAAGCPSAGSLTHPIMFWALTCLSVAMFAPCVLMPAWRQALEIWEYERDLEAVVAGFEARIRRNEARIQALRSDPLVMERIVRRELNRTIPGEELIRWDPETLNSVRVHLGAAILPPTGPQAPPPPTPTWLRQAGRWLPGWMFADIFVTSPYRQLILGMSGALLLAAFLLYPPNRVSLAPDAFAGHEQR